MSFRARLVLLATAAVASTVLSASVVVYFLVRAELRGQVDTGLQQQARRAADLPRITAALLHSRPPPAAPARGPFELENAYQQFISRDGEVLRATPTSGAPSVPAGRPDLPVSAQARKVAAGIAPAFYADANVGGVHLRVFTAPLDQGVAVQVARPLREVDDELRRIELWLALVALGGVAVAGLAGLGVARAALAPVRRLTDAAEHVADTKDLSSRIDIQGGEQASRDELSRLAATFNTMLAALEDASNKQRQLVADASHELRTPLTSLRTNLELLAGGSGADAERILDPEDRRKLMHDVVEQLGEMTELVGELVELARGEEQLRPHEEIRMDLLVHDAVARTLRNHPNCAFAVELDETTVVGERPGIERAVANLLDNAAKWAPPGSTISIGLHDRELTVRDHGPGIDKTDLPHVFDRFYRSSAARSMPGSGLGLSIVRQVAESHGAAVTAERANGGGTLMRLKFP